MSHSIFRRIGLLIGVFAGAWLFFRYLLPIGLPFWLAALLALAAEPLVGVLAGKCRMPRWLAAGIGICIALVLVILATLILGALLLRELGNLAGAVPDLESTAQQGILLLRNWLGGITDRAPEGLQSVLHHGVERIFSGSSEFLDQVSVWLLGFASGALRALPDSALGFGTWIIASFMLSARLPDIRKKLPALLPSHWKDTYLPALKQLRSSVGGWFSAQLKLMGITAGVLAVGFLLLRIPQGILLALLISLVDALPVLGTGTVLIPWSLIAFLQGDNILAVGLLGIYLCISVLRSILEPRLVGKQLGLDPLVTLMALYAGYRLWGLPGMLLSPLLAVCVTQLLLLPKNG